MHFCENCGNMYYIELNKNNTDSLIYYCRNCGNKNDKLIEELNNFCVSKTHIIKDNNQYKNVINEYPEVVAQLRAIYDKWWIKVQSRLVNEDAYKPPVE